MGVYAQNTSVSVERSKGEIEATLRRYGASAFAYSWNGDKAAIAFMMADRMIRFILPLPNRSDDRFCRWAGKPTGSLLRQDKAHEKWEQACRQSWRALNLVIKAKLEAVDSKITTIDQEFLAHFVLPNGGTVGDWAIPQIREAYKKNEMPPLLPQ